MEISARSSLYRRWEAASSSEHAWRWSIAASIALHVAAGIGIVFSPVRHPNIESPSVTVRLLTQEEFERTARPAAMPAPEKPSQTTVNRNPLSEISPSDQAGPARPDAGPRAGAMVQATELFSTSVLAEEGSKQVRATLPLLAKPDRVMQLCNIEAVQQIRRAESELQPDYVVADAITDAELQNVSLSADGGAFRSKGSWYRLKYNCTVTANLRAVASFEFLVGEAIPKREWRKLHLTIEGPSED